MGELACGSWICPPCFGRSASSALPLHLYLEVSLFYLTWSTIITLQYVRPQEDLDHSRQTPDVANKILMDHIYLQLEQELIAWEL
jgi:hypothetical protein